MEASAQIFVSSTHENAAAVSEGQPNHQPRCSNAMSSGFLLFLSVEVFARELHICACHTSRDHPPSPTGAFKATLSRTSLVDFKCIMLAMQVDHVLMERMG